MRYLTTIFSITFATLFFLPLSASAGTTIIPRAVNNLGLVGYWTMDGVDTNSSIVDRSGQGNDGYYINAATSSAKVAGKLGQALSFTAANNTHVVASSTSLQIASNFTVSAWVKLNSLPAAGNFAAIIDQTQSVTAVENYNLDFDYNSSVSPGEGWQFYSDLCSGSVNKYLLSSAEATSTIGQWHHLVGVHNSVDSTMTLYVDGVQRAQNTSCPVGGQALSGPLWIGSDPFGSNLALDGAIDDARVYNRALSATEVTALYRSGSAHVGASSATMQNGTTFNIASSSVNLTSGLVGYWTFDGADITSSILDRSGLGNKGYYINGATSSAKVAGKIGQALNFVSANATYVDIATTSSLSIPGAVTVCTWFKRNTMADGDYVLVNNGNPALLTNAQYDLETHSDGSMFFGWSDGAGTFQDAFSLALISARVWYHTCGVRTAGGAPLIYLNGTDVTDTAAGVPTPSVSPGGDATIGGPGSGQYANGPMDDVRIYNRALSPSEIKQLYNMNAVKFNTSSSNLTNGSTLTDGLVGHWTFDGPDVTTIVADKSGQGNNGYFVGGATSSAKVAGKLGQALSFNGSTSYVDVGNSAPIQLTGSMTLAGWTYLRSTPTALDSDIISKYDVSSRGYKLAYTIDNGPIQALFNISSNGSDNILRYVASTLALNRWYYIVGVYDASAQTMHMYVNGALDDGTLSGTVPASQNNSTDNVNLGRAAEGSGNFDGKLDDLRIYNRALSAAEVKQLYLIGK